MSQHKTPDQGSGGYHGGRGRGKPTKVHYFDTPRGQKELEQFTSVPNTYDVTTPPDRYNPNARGIYVPPRGEPVALDCEMVQVGNLPVLAQVVICDVNNHVIYSSMVQPPPGQVVTSYITWITGFRKESFVNAIPFTQCMDDVRSILNGRILVGHNLISDFKAMKYTHPPHLVRDTTTYRPYQSENVFSRVGKDGDTVTTVRYQPRKLKLLAEEFLGVNMQKKIHFAAEDAITAMRLYIREKRNWEASLRA